jgi:hypothetical protein
MHTSNDGYKETFLIILMHGTTYGSDGPA